MNFCHSLSSGSLRGVECKAALTLDLGVAVGVKVGVGVAVGVYVAVGVRVGVNVGVAVAVGVYVRVGVAVAAPAARMVNLYVLISRLSDARRSSTVPVPALQPARYTDYPSLRSLYSLSAPFEQWFPILLVCTSTLSEVEPGFT